MGKTTTAVNLALFSSEFGYKTLLIDLDPQSNATSGIGINTDSITHSIYDVISNDEKIDDCIYPTPFENLHLLPSSAH